MPTPSEREWTRRLLRLEEAMGDCGFDRPLIDGVRIAMTRLKNQELDKIGRLLTNLIGSCIDLQTFLDFLVEMWAADLFITNGWNVMYEPKGQDVPGPDLSLDQHFLLRSCVFVRI